MIEIFDIREKLEFVREVAELTQKEWGSKCNSEEEFEAKIERKIKKIVSMLDDEKYCKLILVDDGCLIGFISIFPHDCDERMELSPWYATMFVKEEYRGRGYSRILNDAILNEARRRGFERLYLKTELVGYYEKFGWKVFDRLKSGESVYVIEV